MNLNIKGRECSFEGAQKSTSICIQALSIHTILFYYMLLVCMMQFLLIVGLKRQLHNIYL